VNSAIRPPVAIAAAALVSVILASCSSGADEPTHENSGSGTSTARDKAVRFSACMRENGVKDFPDPDASGTLTIDGIANDSSVDTDSPTFTRAIGVCKDLQPAGFTGRKRTPNAQKAALEFAQCIRDHGVKDFPDPVNGEPLVNTNLIPSTNQKGGMTILNAAMQACGKAYSGQLGLKGP
jgi:hypothetical protein